MTVAESLHRLRCFDVSKLPVDPLNVPDGSEFETFLMTNEMCAHRNLRSEISGIWTGRRHHLGSLDEQQIFMELEANPFVMSIREGYPWLSTRVKSAIQEGRPVNRNEVMTFDFMLTLPSRNFMGPLRYEGASSKPASVAVRSSAVRRAAREERSMRELGWTWRRLTVPSPARVRVLKKMRDWATGQTIDDAAREAVILAALLYNTESKKDLGSLLRMLCRRIGVSERDQYFVFATAFYLGYVALNKSAPLGVQHPLLLEKPARSPYGVRIHG